MKNVNGWILMQNIGRYGTDYETRAGVAYMGLGANRREDTIYPTSYLDADGKPYDSASKYVRGGLGHRNERRRRDSST